MLTDGDAVTQVVYLTMFAEVAQAHEGGRLQVSPPRKESSKKARASDEPQESPARVAASAGVGRDSKKLAAPTAASPSTRDSKKQAADARDSKKKKQEAPTAGSSSNQDSKKKKQAAPTAGSPGTPAAPPTEPTPGETARLFTGDRRADAWMLY